MIDLEAIKEDYLLTLRASIWKAKQAETEAIRKGCYGAADIARERIERLSERIKGVRNCV